MQLILTVLERFLQYTKVLRKLSCLVWFLYRLRYVVHMTFYSRCQKLDLQMITINISRHDWTHPSGNWLGIFTIIISKQQTLYISVSEIYGQWCKILFRLYTIYFAKTNGIWMPTVIMVVKVKDNQPVKASGKHCWLRHVGYWLLFDLIYLSNSMIL